MYHIKEDKRSQASADAIVNALQECLNTIPLRSVTVSDIHRTSGISRATFYRLFDTPEDVLHYQFDKMARSLESQLDPALHLEQVIAQGMQYHELIRALMDSRRLDLLFEYTEKSFQMSIATHSLFPKNMDPEEQAYMITHLSMTMVAALITWVRSGQKETPGQVAARLQRCVCLLGQMAQPETMPPKSESGGKHIGIQ